MSSSSAIHSHADILRDLSPGESFEDSERDGDARVEVTSGRHGAHADGEDNAKPVSRTDVEESCVPMLSGYQGICYGGLHTSDTLLLCVAAQNKRGGCADT